MSARSDGDYTIRSEEVFVYAASLTSMYEGAQTPFLQSSGNIACAIESPSYFLPRLVYLSLTYGNSIVPLLTIPTDLLVLINEVDRVDTKV